MRFSAATIIASGLALATAQEAYDTTSYETTYTHTRTVVRVVATTTMTRPESGSAVPTGYGDSPYGNGTSTTVYGTTGGIMPTGSMTESATPMMATNGASAPVAGLGALAVAGLLSLIVV